MVFSIYAFRIVTMPFEKAYCMHRLNRLKEAYNVLTSIENPGLKEKDLLAQVVSRYFLKFCFMQILKVLQ